MKNPRKPNDKIKKCLLKTKGVVGAECGDPPPSTHPQNLGLFQQLTLGAVRGAEAASMCRLAHTDGIRRLSVQIKTGPPRFPPPSSAASSSEVRSNSSAANL